MYLRFYFQTEENIERCIKELKPFMKDVVSITKGKITKSVNLILPLETTTNKNVEVTITFKTEKAEKEFHVNPGNFAIYKKYMTGDIAGAEALMRQKKDLAFAK